MDRNAIIDNSTLTCVQRLMGDIKVYNKYSMDGDILALESLIQAILFSDNLFYIDDYKEKYRETRADRFRYLDAISFNEKDYSELLNQTNKEMDKIIPTVKDGSYVDNDFMPFFEMLKMNNIFTWDMCSSVFYLTQKMLMQNRNDLDIDRFSALQQMIFSETYDEFEKVQNTKYLIVDKNGKPFDTSKSKISSQTNLFLADLSWLAYRTIFYTLVANQLGGDLILHPIRNSFQINLFKKKNPTFETTYNQLLATLNLEAEKTITAIFRNSYPIVSKYILPMFSVSLISKTSDVESVINAALHMRCEGNFVKARGRMSEIEQLFKVDQSKKGIIEANRLVQEVQTEMRILGEKYRVQTNQGEPILPLIEAYNIAAAFSGGQIPSMQSISFPLKILGKAKQFIPQTGFNSVYRSLINDLATVGKIGKYYEKLTAKVNYALEAGHYSAKIEEEKYKNMASYWKKPMNWF